MASLRRSSVKLSNFGKSNGELKMLITQLKTVREFYVSYSKAQANDLTTPVPAYSFPGLKTVDPWCVCAARWLEAYQDGMAPPVRLEACEDSTLAVIPLELLQAHAATR